MSAQLLDRRREPVRPVAEGEIHPPRSGVTDQQRGVGHLAEHRGVEAVAPLGGQDRGGEDPSDLEVGVRVLVGVGREGVPVAADLDQAVEGGVVLLGL
ncbi:hypothetical protein GCM10023321_50370 [Pseudonocardia eucalypti]|uniref:Uncharacterized protein n=1 Tax=Pseudonocardia eucalypti TaxID=648755 RepID=A0ABP9QKI2_9PSEU